MSPLTSRHGELNTPLKELTRTTIWNTEGLHCRRARAFARSRSPETVEVGSPALAFSFLGSVVSRQRHRCPGSDFIARMFCFCSSSCGADLAKSSSSAVPVVIFRSCLEDAVRFFALSNRSVLRRLFRRGSSSLRPASLSQVASDFSHISCFAPSLTGLRKSLHPLCDGSRRGSSSVRRLRVRQPTRRGACCLLGLFFWPFST
jgi:hypothetical protein